MRQAEQVPTARPARSEPTDALYDEQLRVPVSWWIVTFFVALAIGAVTLRFQVSYGERLVIALVTAAVAFVLLAWPVTVYGRAHIRVAGQTLWAGQAAIPLTALGTVYPLDEEQARALRGPEADTRAFMLLRSYVRTAVRVEVTDDADPTPYLYLSTRRPGRLARALEAARAGI